DYVLISDGQSLHQYTTSGVLIRDYTFTTGPGGDGGSRGVTVDKNGNFQIFDGTFSPYLTTVDRVTGNTLSNVTTAGWSTANASFYGAIGAFGNYVFVPDFSTGSGGGANGIVRFNVNDGTAVRFSSGDYANLAMGLDGLLYAGGGPVNVFDPTSLALV